MHAKPRKFVPPIQAIRAVGLQRLSQASTTSSLKESAERVLLLGVVIPEYLQLLKSILAKGGVVELQLTAKVADASGNVARAQSTTRLRA
jgi:predicted transcriptional regulator